MDRGKVRIVNLAKRKIGEAPAMVFGGLLVTMLGLAGLERADTPQTERREFFIYLDEFQTFTTLALVDMLAELRKYGVEKKIDQRAFSGAVRSAYGNSHDRRDSRVDSNGRRSSSFTVGGSSEAIAVNGNRAAQPSAVRSSSQCARRRSISIGISIVNESRSLPGIGTTFPASIMASFAIAGSACCSARSRSNAERARIHCPVFD